jgi:tetratricopeptide (TPR) repeat protein
MRKPKKKSIFFLIALGIGLAVIIIEISLNLLAAIHHPRFNSKQTLAEQANPDIYQIVCLGDSYTYGLGAGFDNSYPAQLETILNKSRTNKIFQVQNLGIPGETTKKSLNKLIKILSKNKPDMVIILSGINDTWSFSDYFKTSMFLGIDSLSPKNLFPRIIKLFDLIRYNLKTPIAPGSDIPSIIKTANLLRDKKQFKNAEAYYQQALLLDAQHPTALLELGRCQKLDKQYSAAGSVLEKAFMQDPENKIIQAELSDLFIKQQNIPAEFFLLIKLKNHFPNNLYLIERLCYVYSILSEPYFSSNLAKQIVDSQTKTLNINNLNHKELELLQAYYYKKHNSAKKTDNQLGSLIDISQLRYRNLEKAIELCKQKKIDLIFSGYPSILLEDTKTLAEKYNIPLIDHRLKFYNLMQEYSPSKFFVSDYDRHCTAQGYQVIAENIAAAVLQTVANNKN